jgi:hypothetical protein
MSFESLFGLTMPTLIIQDRPAVSHIDRRFETDRYGTRACPHYKPGRPYRIPKRRTSMAYIDDDVEQAVRGDPQWLSNV